MYPRLRLIHVPGRVLFHRRKDGAAVSKVLMLQTTPQGAQVLCMHVATTRVGHTVEPIPPWLLACL